MDPLPIVIIFVPIVILSGAVFFTRRMIRRSEDQALRHAEDRRAKLKRARPATATIVSFDETSTSGMSSIGKASVVRVVLEVHDRDREPYRATAKWLVTPMGAGNIRHDATVPVRIDADDPKIIYPDMKSVEYSG